MKSGAAAQMLIVLRQKFSQSNRGISAMVALLIEHTLPALLALHGNTLQT